ncbi:MAG TPA: SAM-dependent methyltransferase [Thermoanaerobaculia bacterium]|nr:SAM-dependent methyltransferase [Thermoanaerobaculia bacterium]
MSDVLRNALHYGDLSFRDFVELALYHPQFGYYARSENPVGKDADYVTAPVLSPVFSFALSNLVREFVRRNEGALCSIVDIGCGDGGLIESVARCPLPVASDVRFFGVDRELGRVALDDSTTRRLVDYVRTIDELPRDGAHLFISNELYDAFPFARLVKRGEHVHELWVTVQDGVLDWTEREAPPAYDDYFAANGVELAEGQFADVSLEWEAYHADVARFLQHGLIVTIDYGFPANKLFHTRARRFGTAAAYAGQRVSRDLLANPGEQDLTAHVNFSDLERAGEHHGATTLFFDRMAKFLLSLGVTEHELFRPVHDLSIDNPEQGMQLIEAREEARRLVLPDGIGEEMRVLVQAKNVELDGWSFQQTLY